MDACAHCAIKEESNNVNHPYAPFTYKHKSTNSPMSTIERGNEHHHALQIPQILK